MPKFAANLTMLFNEVPFMERFAAAKAAGFEAVEYPIKHASSIACGLKRATRYTCHRSVAVTALTKL